MDSMSASSTPTWLDGFGDWAWPGLMPAAELAPAAWVPALPLRIEPPVARLHAERPRGLPRPLRLARLALLVAVAGGTFVVSNGLARSGQPFVTTPQPLRLAGSLTNPFAVPSALAAGSVRPATTALGGLAPALPTPLPAPVTLSTDAAGSRIASIGYPSQALGWRDHYLVYLPPGYRAQGTRRYPVLYLLHGDNQPASSFLRLGLQPTLDRLITAHAIAPLIAVMLQADGLPNNWRNGAPGGLPGPRYNDYIGEVQRLTDRVLRTRPERASRGIAGYSMGGFGAMNVALSQLPSYSVVESWEGYFNNLSSVLAADRPLLAHLPLHAFVYGGLSDRVTGYAEDGPWAAALRGAGADAHSAIYPGTHSFTPLAQHLTQMLTFAGRALRS
jgi:S-formylglutathione hydrolase FrmB